MAREMNEAAAGAGKGGKQRRPRAPRGDAAPGGAGKGTGTPSPPADLRFLPGDQLIAWLEGLAADEGALVTPDATTGELAPWRGGEPLLKGPSPVSGKGMLLPQAEVYLSYGYGKDGAVTVTTPDSPARFTVFGVRLCDTRAVLALDGTFGAAGPSGADAIYKARREAATLIAVACREEDVDKACFCGTFAAAEDWGAADVVLHAVDGGYALRVLTKKGAAAAGAARGARAAADLVPPPPARGAALELAGIDGKCRAVFEDEAFWARVTEKCLSCGVCTFVCPNCYCFTISDEPRDRRAGDRLRSWDACTFACYTREASGHNPRSTGARRYRNRVNHKFNYYPALHGLQKCVGCGRCVRLCPAALDIRDVLEAVMAT